MTVIDTTIAIATYTYFGERYCARTDLPTGECECDIIQPHDHPLAPEQRAHFRTVAAHRREHAED